jgi:hypothetical protein
MNARVIAWQDSQIKWRRNCCHSSNVRLFWSGTGNLKVYVMEPPTRQSIARIREKFEVDGTVHKQRSGTTAGLTSKSERYVTTDGQSAGLSWCQVPSWAQDPRVCWCAAPYPIRGRVCRLQFLLVLASAVVLGSESRGLLAIFYCRRFQNPLTYRDVSPYLYPPGTG